MTHHPTRRQFVQTSIAAGVTIATAPGIATSYARNEKLRMALIGVGGRAGAGLGPALGQHLVAVAEVDPKERGRGALERIQKDSPDTKIYTDFRELFDKHQDLDAVWIGTPDHTHFPAAIRALESGAGVYCEKPLTWSVYEARKLREVTLAKKLPTQMGNQGHSSESIREIVDYIRSGTLGEIRKVDCISNRSFSANKRSASQPVPAGLDWEAWLGPAPKRDYHGGLHPFNWRGWLDFGTGSLGDMGCHTIDGAVWGLKLNEVDRFEIEAKIGKPTEEGFPGKAIMVFRFPERGEMPPVELTWYQGGEKPEKPDALGPNEQVRGEGTYYYGSKGMMSSGSHCQDVRLHPESFAKETAKPPRTVERSPHGHTGDWIAACKDPESLTPSSNFDYGARLTELVLVGNIACMVEGKLTYDFKEGRFTNNDKANEYLNRKPRTGWEFGYENA